MARPERGRAREAILLAAERLFYRDGIRAVGVDAIAEAVGVTKRTLYYHFATKDDLVAAYLASHDATNRATLVEQSERFGPLPGDHVLGLFEAFAARFDGPEFRGCAFLNAMAEGGESRSVRECATAHKDGVRDWIAGKLQGAAEPDVLAEQVMLLLDGALIRSLIHPGSATALRAAAAAESLLRLANVPLTPRV